jgi:hypothetical protein
LQVHYILLQPAEDLRAREIDYHEMVEGEHCSGDSLSDKLDS